MLIIMFYKIILTEMRVNEYVPSAMDSISILTGVNVDKELLVDI